MRQAITIGLLIMVLLGIVFLIAQLRTAPLLGAWPGEIEDTEEVLLGLREQLILRDTKISTLLDHQERLIRQLQGESEKIR